MSSLSPLSFKVNPLSSPASWHSGALWRRGRRGNLAKEPLFGVGFVREHLSLALCFVSTAAAHAKPS